MCFAIDWRLLILIQGIEHNENGHIQSKRGAITNNSDYLGNNSLIVLHYYPSDDPIEHRQSLIVGEFGNFTYE